jgi:hypothetical protein
MSSVDQEGMLTWIKHHWTHLVAFAWRSYLASGRGLVILEGDFADDMNAAYQTPMMAASMNQSWP